MQEYIRGALKCQTGGLPGRGPCYYWALHTVALECVQFKIPAVVTWIIPALFLALGKRQPLLPLKHQPLVHRHCNACCLSAMDAAAACVDAGWLQRLQLQPLRLLLRLRWGRGISRHLTDGLPTKGLHVPKSLLPEGLLVPKFYLATETLSSTSACSSTGF